MKKQKKKIAIENIECLIFGLGFRSTPEVALTHNLLSDLLAKLIDDLKDSKNES